MKITLKVKTSGQMYNHFYGAP